MVQTSGELANIDPMVIARKIVLKWSTQSVLWNSKCTMDNLPQKKSLVFLGLFYSFRKKKQLCRRMFFNSSPFSSRKLNLKTQFLYNNTTRSGWFPPKKPEKPLFLNFQIEFSRRKRARIEKNSSTKLFHFAIRIK
jgi:hypothetical protein